MATGTDHRQVSALRRFRRLMLTTVSIVPLAIGAAFLSLWLSGQRMHVHLLLSLGLGIALTLLLAGALMGLLFFSASAGIDEAQAQDEDERL